MNKIYQHIQTKLFIHKDADSQMTNVELYFIYNCFIQNVAYPHNYYINSYRHLE